MLLDGRSIRRGSRNELTLWIPDGEGFLVED
jgi:hypothetical protein